MKHMIVKLLLK